MNDLEKALTDITSLDLRQVLRTFYYDAELCETNGDREQLITRVVEVIRACRYCAFEKEQRALGDKWDAERLANIMRPLPKKGDK